MVDKKKEIDMDRAYANPINGEVVYSHYTDGTEIVLSPEKKKVAEEAKAACIAVSIRSVENDVKAREKPLEKRGRAKQEDKKQENKKQEDKIITK